MFQGAGSLLQGLTTHALFMKDTILQQQLGMIEFI